MKKLMSLAAFGAGYVLGARAGRERYDQLMKGFTRVRDDPRVQEQAQRVTEMAKEQAPGVVEKVTDVTSSAIHKVRPSSDAANPDASSDTANPDESPESDQSAEQSPDPAAQI